MISILPLVLLASAARPATAADSAASPSIDDEKALQASVGANRIVGMWSVSVAIGPCGGPVTLSFRALNTFHQGRTLSDTNSASSTTRGPGQGVWTHHGRGLYDARTQFYRFQANGAFDGVQDIANEIVLDPRGRRYESTVRARALNVDGSLRAELCGTAIGERITVD